MSPAIHVYGMAGHNLGDDAVAFVAQRVLRERFPQAAVRSACLVPGAFRARYGLEEVPVDRRSLAGLARLLGSVRRADAVLVGGGTLVQDALGITPLQGNLPFTQQIVDTATALGKPVLSFGLGVDALETRLGRYFASRVLRRPRFHYFRDERSADLAKLYAGASLSPHVIGADPAILIDTYADSRHDAAMPGRYALVSLVNERLDLEAWLSGIVAAQRALQETHGIQELVLLAMDRRETEEIAQYRELVERLDLHGLKSRIVVPENALDAFEWIRHAEAMVAMRLHAMILGLGFTPMIAISRTTKTDTFTREAGIESFDVREAVGAATLARALTAQLASKDMLQRQLVARNALQRRAQGAIDRLALVLEGTVGSTGPTVVRQRP